MFSSCFLEIFYRNSLIPAIGRAMFTLLFGLNFMHTAFILYPPWIYAITDNPVDQKFDLKSHSAMVKVNVLFAFEICLCSMLTLMIFGIVYNFNRKEFIRLNGKTNSQAWMTAKGDVDGQYQTSKGYSNGNCHCRENKLIA